MEEELEEGMVMDVHGDIHLEDDCVTLHDGEFCHIDDSVFCCSDDCYYLNEDKDAYNISWCYHYEQYYFEDDMVWCELNDGGEGFVHNDSDYAYSEYSDRYFQDEDTASNRGFTWSERLEDWVPEDECHDEETWDCTTKTKDTMFTKTFGMPYTFGVELETCSGYLDYNSDYNLKCVDDGSIAAKEYVTGILQGDKGVKMLHQICDAVANNCCIDKSCGVHIHIGGANFNRRFSILSIMLGQMMQTQLFNINPKSRRDNTYCKVIPDKFKELRTVNKREFPYTHKRMLSLLCDYLYNGNGEFTERNCKKSVHPNGHYADTRYKWLNLNNCSYKGRGETIEFRQHSGSLDFIKIRKWLLFCMSYVNFVENHSRTIIETYNKFQEDPAIYISMREVLVTSLGSEGDIIADYYDKREERFN